MRTKSQLKKDLLHLLQAKIAPEYKNLLTYLLHKRATESYEFCHQAQYLPRNLLISVNEEGKLSCYSQCKALQLKNPERLYHYLHRHEEEIIYIDIKNEVYWLLLGKSLAPYELLFSYPYHLTSFSEIKEEQTSFLTLWQERWQKQDYIRLLQASLCNNDIDEFQYLSHDFKQKWGEEH